jgi:hypothetical protein
MTGPQTGGPFNFTKALEYYYLSNMSEMIYNDMNEQEENINRKVGRNNG